MTDWTNRFLNLWTGGADARRYGLVRAGFGLLAFVQVVHLWPYRHAFYSQDGMASAGAAADLNPGLSLSVFQWADSPAAVTAIFLLAGLAALLFAAGILSRAMAFLVWFFLLSTLHFSPLSSTGWDFVLGNFFFLLLFSPLGEKRESGNPARAPLLPRYGLTLMQLQVLVIYWQSAFVKFVDQAWQSGEYLSYFFLSHHGRFDGAWPAGWTGFLSLFTYASLLIELALPILLWKRSTRRIGFIAGIVFHLAILVLAVNIGMFSLTMLVTYLVFVEFERPATAAEH